MRNSGLRLSREDYDEFYFRLGASPMTEAEIAERVLDRLDKEARGEAAGIGYDLYVLALPPHMMDRIAEAVRRERGTQSGGDSRPAA